MGGLAFLCWLWTSAGPCLSDPQASADNAELERMYIQDQADRGAFSKASPLDYDKLGAARALMKKHDGERYLRLEEILRAHLLHTGADYFHAAMLLQHGGVAADYLRAHQLATQGALLGHLEARELAGKSLDRLLLKLGQKQVFGSQYYPESAGWVLKDFDANLLPDSTRIDFHLRSRAQSRAILDRIRAGQGWDEANQVESLPLPTYQGPDSAFIRTVSTVSQVLEVVRSEGLHTRADYFRAATLLAGSDKPEDLLLGHILASEAGFRGAAGAAELIESTLSRYLHAIQADLTK